MPESFPKPAHTAIEDKKGFLKRYASEVRGLLESEEERALLDRGINDPGSITADDEPALDSLIERFGTKIFQHEKARYAPDAKRVLITSNDPGSWNAVQRLIELLESDERCKSITAVVSGRAREALKKRFPDFSETRSAPSVLEDALLSAEHSPIDIAIGSVSSRNGPESLALYAGKSLGAKRTYLVFEGYGALGSSFTDAEQSGMEHIDGIFVNDALAAELISEKLPGYPEERIHALGSLATEGFELEKADVYRKEGREKLGIDEHAFVVGYLGDVSTDYATMEDVSPDINARTFEQTLDAVAETARARGALPTALIIRTHPRDPDKERLLNAPLPTGTPDTFRAVPADGKLTMNETAYASDVLVSIASTENFFAPLRGRKSVFLAYEDDLGAQALRNTYSPGFLEKLAHMENISIAHSPEELSALLAAAAETPTQPSLPVASNERAVLDQLFATA